MKRRKSIVNFNHQESKILNTKKNDSDDAKDDDSSTPIGCFIFLFFMIFMIAVFGIIIGDYMEAWSY